ncbi:probable WRKY transcription factor 67 [Dioscorea cayenensis subsp. rotundata]|uniref:Probable WRKY transcription factor 67 n=1 Tax=Dioscorea cayennensis subsp. rotundata TaxID=55577 RepID=A0AB40AL48_DIOCR|nr:probable WRKY transcription factor 67 [Dioscorea cayenensis subsp. rotundata]
MMGAMEKPLIMRKDTLSCEKEKAIQHITRGYELTKQLQSMVLFCGEPCSELPAGVLFEEVLQALTTALTNLKFSTSDPKTIKETSSFCLSDDQGSETSNEINSGSRKRRKVIPWTKVTYAPHDDGYQWRKYGQKNIQKSKSSRSYYRCTYRDEGCRATKYVEEKDCNDPQLFSVTYFEKHTCRVSNDPIISPEIKVDQLLPKEPNLFSFESNDNMFSSLGASGTQQSINGQERVDLQNMHINDQTTIESVGKSTEDCLWAMLEPWEAMSLDYLVNSSFGSDDGFLFSSF